MRVFELSYQGRVGWNGAEHGWLWADAASARKSRRNYIVNASIDQAAIGLGMATLMGACIGFERQSRQRMAGLRTNTLVAIGAAKARRLVRMTKLTIPVISWAANVSDHNGMFVSPGSVN